MAFSETYADGDSRAQGLHGAACKGPLDLGLVRLERVSKIVNKHLEIGRKCMRFFVRQLPPVLGVGLHEATGVALQRLQFLQNGVSIAHDASLGADRLFRIDVNQACHLSLRKTLIRDLTDKPLGLGIPLRNRLKEEMLQ